MEFVHCCLGGSFFVLGAELRPPNDPNLQANLNFQAGPTNKSSIFEDGWGTFASATHNISWGHPFLRMGGDALSCLRVKAEG